MGAWNLLNPLTKGNIWAANCQTPQTWPLYIWPLKKRQLPPKAPPDGSWNRTGILSGLNMKSSECGELTRTSPKSYLSCMPPDWPWFVHLLHPFVTLCVYGLSSVLLCVPCKKPSLITSCDVTELGILNLFCNCNLTLLYDWTQLTLWKDTAGGWAVLAYLWQILSLRDILVNSKKSRFEATLPEREKEETGKL